MSNPLFNMFGGMMPNNMGNMTNIIQQFQRFKNSFKGDPRQQIQMMLNSGRISQEQYNNAVQMANVLQKMINNQ